MTNRIRFYEHAVRQLSRREVLNVAWQLGAAALIAPCASTRLRAQPVFRTYPFALGVASGDPLLDGVVLWTRLAPEPLDGGGMPAANVEVNWEVAQEPAMRRVVSTGATVARPELGHSVHVEIQGLEPGREYWYRFRVGGEVSQIGRTVTAPAANAAVDRVRFGVCVHLATIDLEAEGQAFSWAADGSRSVFTIDRRRGLVRRIEIPALRSPPPGAVRFRAVP